MFAALPSLLLPVAGQFLPETVMKWLNVALGIIAQGKNVMDRLNTLDAEIRDFAERGVEPDEAWWAKYTTLSDTAHDAIQRAGREARSDDPAHNGPAFDQE